MFLGILTFFFIPSFPDQNTFLTPEQTAMVLKRIDDDRGDALPDPVTFKKFITHLQDWTLWAYGRSTFLIFPQKLNACPGFMFLFAAMPSCMNIFFRTDFVALTHLLDSQSFFLPIILKGMGWSTTSSLLLVCSDWINDKLIY